MIQVVRTAVWTTIEPITNALGMRDAALWRQVVERVGCICMRTSSRPGTKNRLSEPV